MNWHRQEFQRNQKQFNEVNNRNEVKIFSLSDVLGHRP